MKHVQSAYCVQFDLEPFSPSALSTARKEKAIYLQQKNNIYHPSSSIVI